MWSRGGCDLGVSSRGLSILQFFCFLGLLYESRVGWEGGVGWEGWGGREGLALRERMTCNSVLPMCALKL